MCRKKRIYVWILLLGCATVQANFEQTEVRLHPNFPWPGPFILEVVGTWPSDCHPGEQKPVVSAHDATSVAITFEIIVVHITCNAIATPYRVLVDLSNLASTFTEASLQVQVEFGGSLGAWTVALRCNPAVDFELCPGGRVKRVHVQPDSGLYYADGLDKQGMLLARQNRALAAYPLVYDESGDAKWLFSGNVYSGDAFFGDLYEFSGGQCLECPPPTSPAGMSPAGHVTLLFDSPHQVQVKFNDQLFVEYRPLSFGYGTVAGDDGGEGLVNLSGKWAVSWQRPPGDPPDDAATQVAPLVFEIWKTSSDDAAPGTVAYAVVDLAGAEVAQINCDIAIAIPCVWHSVPSPWNYGGGEDLPLTILSHRRIGYVLAGEGGQLRAEAVRID